MSVSFKLINEPENSSLIGEVSLKIDSQIDSGFYRIKMKISKPWVRFSPDTAIILSLYIWYKPKNSTTYKFWENHSKIIDTNFNFNITPKENWGGPEISFLFWIRDEALWLTIEEPYRTVDDPFLIIDIFEDEIISKFHLFIINQRSKKDKE